jgi:hypothetical protein
LAGLRVTPPAAKQAHFLSSVRHKCLGQRHFERVDQVGISSSGRTRAAKQGMFTHGMLSIIQVEINSLRNIGAKHSILQPGA